MAMVTKLGRMVTYHEMLWLLKSNGPLITWSQDKLKALCLQYHNIYDYIT